MPPASTLAPARAFALGLLHGPAELLPVSSSAHAELLLGRLEPDRRKEMEVALHAGTLLALGPPRPAVWLVIATAPAALAGVLFERPIEERLGGPRSLAAGLLLGGIAMAATDLRGSDPFRFAKQPMATGSRPRKPRDHGVREKIKVPDPGDAVALGFAQAAALVPGVSRHGAALCVLRARGFSRPDAHAISREASKPVLLGATALKGMRALRRAEGLAPLAAAVAGSAVSTRLAARALDGRGVRSPLWPFALYRAGLAASVWRMRTSARA